MARPLSSATDETHASDTAPRRGASVHVAGLEKSFGPNPVLRGVDLDVPEGSITAILGPSGSGKTTLLRLVAGFDRVGRGVVSIGRRVMDDGRHVVRAQHRGIGYVPQEGALFPHLTVAKNVGFGVPRRQRSQIASLLEMVGLVGLERRYPHQLSGGQQQRVALARALAVQPKVVLLDEPFSSLDASLREEVREDVARILAASGTTALLVTHDQDEALALADQVAVLYEGVILAVDDPRRLYDDPPSLAVARLVGEANVVAATVRGGSARSVLGEVDVVASKRDVAVTATALEGPVQLLLRPEQVVVRDHPVEGAKAATVVSDRYHGHDAMIQLALSEPDAPTWLARVSGDLVLTPGQRVWVEVRGPGRAWPAVPRA